MSRRRFSLSLPLEDAQRLERLRELYGTQTEAICTALQLLEREAADGRVYTRKRVISQRLEVESGGGIAEGGR